MKVYFTVDMEQDCPPYMSTFRGVEEGTQPLLDLLGEENVQGTFFTTGNVALRFPKTIEQIVAAGHELACHGHTHGSFASMDETTARGEIRDSAEALRPFAQIRSFRAPYLRFPAPYLPLLEEAGFAVDSSQAKYKLSYYTQSASTALERLPTSVTSSVLRLPPPIRDRWLRALSSPVVLFVHPWEFVDLTKTSLRWDCRFNTGKTALERLQSTLRLFKGANGTFSTVGELAR